MLILAAHTRFRYTLVRNLRRTPHARNTGSETHRPAGPGGYVYSR